MPKRKHSGESCRDGEIVRACMKKLEIAMVAVLKVLQGETLCGFGLLNSFKGSIKYLLRGGGAISRQSRQPLPALGRRVMSALIFRFFDFRWLLFECGVPPGAWPPPGLVPTMLYELCIEKSPVKLIK